MKKSLTLLSALFLVCLLHAQQVYLIEVTQIADGDEQIFTDELQSIEQIEEMLEESFRKPKPQSIEDAFMRNQHPHFTKVYQSILTSADDAESLAPARRIRPGDWQLEKWAADENSEVVLFSNQPAAKNPLLLTSGRGFLGVLTEHANGDGVLVSEVIEETAAEKYGIKTGDILLQVNDEPIRNNNHFGKLIKTYKPGDLIQIKLQRDGSRMTVESRLTDYDDYLRVKAEQRKVAREKRRQERKAWLESQPPRLGVFIEDTGKGVAVTGVDRNSSAAKAGLAEGDIILRVDEESTLNTDRLQEVIQSYKIGDQVNIYYQRDGVSTFAVATLSGPPSRRFGCGTGFSKRTEQEETTTTTIRITKTQSATTRNETLNELKVVAFRAYPNPSQGMVQVDVQVEKGALATLNVLDGQGRQVQSFFINDATRANTYTVDLSREPAGLYQIQLTQGDKQINRQIVISR